MEHQQDATCPSCETLVPQGARTCPHCGADLVWSSSFQPLTRLESEAPTAAYTSPTGQTTSGGLPSIVVTVNANASPPQKPPRPTRPLLHAPNLWIVGVVALVVALILGVVIVPGALRSPRPAAAPTATRIPTATPIPQARVVVQLVDVMCVTKRDFFSGDSFYIKSSLTAPGVGNQPGTTRSQITNHYTLNDGDRTAFNQADQVIFDALVPLSGIVTGSLTAYADDDTQELDTTNVNVSAADTGQTISWHIQGRSGLNTWEYYVRYATTITRIAAAPALGEALLGSLFWQQDAVLSQPERGRL
jgi:hypothetical protein